MTTATKDKTETIDAIYNHYCIILDGISHMRMDPPVKALDHVVETYIHAKAMAILKNIELLTKKTFLVQNTWKPYAEIERDERVLFSAVCMLSSDGVELDFGKDTYSLTKQRRVERIFASSRDFFVQELAKKNEFKPFDPRYASTRKDGTQLLLELVHRQHNRRVSMYESIDGSLYRNATYKGKSVCICTEGDGERVVGSPITEWNPLD